MDWLLLFGGLFVLVCGGEIFVRGAAGFARLLGLSPLVIGLTVVAFGTSAPELGVSLKAALDGQAPLAFGNVAGSNIFNVLMILGLSALLAPLKVQSQLVKTDVPVMIGASILLYGLVWNGMLGRVEGVLLFCLALAYTGWLVYAGRRERESLDVETQARNEPGPQPRQIRTLIKNGGFLVLGFAALVLGSDWSVTSAVRIAGSLGISERLVGLTILAAGTSLPELVTSIVATVRGERDLAVGNVVGSNIFNILVILGATATLTPGGVPAAEKFLKLDLPVMLGVALLCLPVFFTGKEISRKEGLLFLSLYAAYVFYVFYATSS